MAQASISDPARIAAVEATFLVDSPPEENFDRYTRLAQRILGVEMAIVSLVLEDRQFYKSSVGLPEPLATDRCSPIADSLCKIGVERGAPLAISDGPTDPEFFDHPAIKAGLLRSYLGVPFTDQDGHALGTLCVANTQPREWTDSDIEILTTLAHAVGNEVHLHKAEQARLHVLQTARHERELLGRIMDTSLAAITVLDIEGRILRCNEAAERVLGLSPSHLKDRLYNDPEWHATDVDGGPWPDENNPFRRVLATRQSVHDIRHAIEWPDGTRRILSISGAPLRDESGKITRMVFLINDITEQHASNQHLNLVAQQFSQSFRFSSNWVMLCDFTARTIVEVSEGLLQSLELTRPACIGRRLDELGVHFSLQKINQLFAVHESAPQSDSVELRLQDTQDRFRLIEVRSQLIEVGREKFLSIGGQDVTDQRLEKHRRATLERQLREAQKAEVVGQLTGGIAHDFNNILTAIIGNADLAAQFMPAQHPAQRAVAAIKKAGQRAAEQIRQILSLSRKEQPAVTKVDVCRVIEDTVQVFRAHESSRITVAITVPPHPVYVASNAAQIDQILMNLLNNASQASNGEGRIEIRLIEFLSDKKEELADSEMIVVEVEDHGTGIDAVNLPLVFEPFFTTKESASGTGIGLALARTIARSFEGDLTVDSQLGAGATFRLLLPRAPEDNPVAPPSTPAEETHRPSRLKIILIDDDPSVLSTGTMLLEQLGHHVVATDDPEAALESLSTGKSHFDLIITDNLMPKLTGVELIQELRRRHVDTPIILVSGYGTARAQIEKLATRRTRFLPKPFTLKELAEHIAASVTT